MSDLHGLDAHITGNYGEDSISGDASDLAAHLADDIPTTERRTRRMSMKPRIPHEFFINDDLGDLSPLHRLLFLGLLALSADDDGVLEDRPRRIQAQVLPYDDEANVYELLGDLESVGLIVRHPAENEGEQPLILISDYSERWQLQETDPNS